MARRNLTKGQLAIVAAKVFPERRTAGRKAKNTVGNMAFPMVNKDALSQARVTVNRSASPDIRGAGCERSR